MFLDFAVLVEQQGELLDQIEYQVKSASDYIEEGNKEVAQAIEIQKSIRKKQCCIIITCLVIIGVIVGIILASLAAQGKLGNISTSSSGRKLTHTRRLTIHNSNMVILSSFVRTRRGDNDKNKLFTY